MSRKLAFILFLFGFLFSSDLNLLCSEQAETFDFRVFFNQKTLKYHRPDCSWAERCTENCFETTLKQALQKKGIACKVCHPPSKLPESRTYYEALSN